MATTGTIYDETVKFGPAKLLVAATISSPVAFVSFPTIVGDSIEACGAFHFDILVTPATLGSYLCAQTTDNNGVAWTPIYYQVLGYAMQQGGNDALTYANTAQMQVSHGCHSSVAIEFLMFIKRGGGFQGHLSWQSSCYTGGTYGLGSLYGSGGYAGITGVRFNFSSGNIASGRIRAYGTRTGA